MKWNEYEETEETISPFPEHETMVDISSLLQEFLILLFPIFLYLYAIANVFHVYMFTEYTSFTYIVNDGEKVLLNSPSPSFTYILIFIIHTQW